MARPRFIILGVFVLLALASVQAETDGCAEWAVEDRLCRDAVRLDDDQLAVWDEILRGRHYYLRRGNEEFERGAEIELLGCELMVDRSKWRTLKSGEQVRPWFARCKYRGPVYGAVREERFSNFLSPRQLDQKLLVPFSADPVEPCTHWIVEGKFCDDDTEIGVIRLARWENDLVGRTLYLREIDRPFLKNDEIVITGCTIQNNLFRPAGAPTMPDRSVRCQYRGTDVEAESEFHFPNVASPEELDRFLATTFSELPLEESYDWPVSARQAVRERKILLGMDPEMVELSLGGFEPLTDRGLLDDGRIQETWKVMIKPTSKIESASSLTRFWIDPPPEKEKKRHASRLTPVLLNIEFTDGAVTARDTEYLETRR